MALERLPAELETRITEIEQERGQGAGFTRGDWLFLLASGVVFPALLLIWGW